MVNSKPGPGRLRRASKHSGRSPELGVGASCQGGASTRAKRVNSATPEACLGGVQPDRCGLGAAPEPPGWRDWVMPISARSKPTTASDTASAYAPDKCVGFARHECFGFRFLALLTTGNLARSLPLCRGRRTRIRLLLVKGLVVAPLPKNQIATVAARRRPGSASWR